MYIGGGGGGGCNNTYDRHRALWMPMSFNVIHCHHSQCQSCLARCSYHYLTCHSHCHYCCHCHCHWMCFALLRFCRHAASDLQAGSHMQGIFLRPNVAKRNKRACNNRIHTQCTNASSHNTFAVQVDTVAVNLQCRQAQETFYRRRLIWSQHFWCLHFPTMAPLVFL